MKDSKKTKTTKSVGFGDDEFYVYDSEFVAPENTKRYPQNLKSAYADVPIDRPNNKPELTQEEQLEEFKKELDASLARAWGNAYIDKDKASTDIAIDTKLSRMSMELGGIINNDFKLQISINDAFNKSGDISKIKENFAILVNNSQLSKEHKEELRNLGEELIQEREKLEVYTKLTVLDRLKDDFDQIMDDVPGRKLGNPLIDAYCDSLKTPEKQEEYLSGINKNLEELVSDTVELKDSLEEKKYHNKIAVLVHKYADSIIGMDLDKIQSKTPSAEELIVAENLKERRQENLESAIRTRKEKIEIIDNIIKDAGLESKKEKIKDVLGETLLAMDSSELKDKSFQERITRDLKKASHNKYYITANKTIETKKIHNIRASLENDNKENNRSDINTGTKEVKHLQKSR